MTPIEAPALAGIPHAFFTRQGGVSEGLYATLNGGLGSNDAPERVTENRRRMAVHLGADALASLHQVHSAQAVVVEAPFDPQDRPKADGMATWVPGLALGILTADCGPLLFADAQAGVVGAAHAGWKGALGGVAEATLDAMEGLGAARSRVVAVLGPMIGAGAYEVGPEFVARFLEADASHARYFRTSPERAGHAFFDLPGFVVARLKAAGVGTVIDLGLCTYADPERFYSYRRTTHLGERDYGRLVSAIALPA